MEILILNDLHLGVKRMAGATPESRKSMENWMFSTLEAILENVHYDVVIVAGDLCDKRTVPEHIMLKIIKVFNDALDGREVVVMLGNHDEGGKAVTNDQTISSAELITELLNNSILVKGAPASYHGLYLIPHMFNQEEFDKAVAECPHGATMICHCNVDSPFAVGDSSLNLSAKQIAELKEEEVMVIAGHEHIQRDAGVVKIPGNQIPTNIGDLSKCERKILYVYDTESEGLREEEVFNVSSIYKEYHYTDLLACKVPLSPLFIKIVGTCTTEEWPEVLRKYAELRKSSTSLVISNKVEVPAYTIGDVSAEKVSKFNVEELFLAAIDKEFREEVKSVIKIN